MIREVFGRLSDPFMGIAFLVLALIVFVALIWPTLCKKSADFAEESRLPLEEANHE
jgi:hypothetical protein